MLLILSCSLSYDSIAQIKDDPFNSSRTSVGKSDVSVFNQGRKSNFNDYRQKLNVEYVKMTRETWRDFNAFRAELLPDRNDKPVKPIEMSDEEAKRSIKGKDIGYDKVENPFKRNNRALPIAPLSEIPEQMAQFLSFSYLGTNLKVRRPQSAKPALNGTDENSVADAWQELSAPSYNNMVIDCLKLRSTLGLSDWGYLLMLQAIGDTWCGKGTNASTLLMSYLYSQSGYKIRIGQSNGKLEMLYASQHNIYNRPYYNIDGDKFYPFNKETTSVNINSAHFSKEQPLSLWITQEQKVSSEPSTERTLVSKRYPEMAIRVSINKNLLPFYDSYPVSDIGGDFMTRWAMYADTPVCSQAREELYPQLRSVISGMSQLDAVNRLLNWVQTAFVYEYDDKVWGHDRAFFPDETLYYPYCDCEDRAILFTRLVRDLLGLKCILIYYPGHLASAVCFTENVDGDYLNVNGNHFVVCDPTFIGAPVGRTMTGMDNGSAKVILL